MLRFKRTGDVIEVKQTIMSFNDTFVEYWYYNVKTWLSSVHGKKGDKLIHPICQGSIDWVKKHYLPKC